MERSEQYILAGWLIDGTGGPLRKRVMLHIVDGLIATIADDFSGDRPPAEQTVDLSYGIILPWFIDSHVHLCMSGTIDPRARENQARADCPELFGLVAEHLRNQFSHGVLGVRDGGDRQGCVLQYKTEHHTVEPTAVSIRAAGQAVHVEGRYGNLIGAPVVPDSINHSLLPRAADQLKVVNSGVNSLTEFGLQTRPQFSVEQMTQFVALAHGQNKKVMVHANGELPVQQALESGCDSIEHGFFMGRENLARLAESSVYWVPTIYTMKAFSEHIDMYRGAARAEVVARTLAHQQEQVAYARSCGVKIALGSDAGSLGVLHGEALVQELKMLMQAGLSLTEAVQCATEHGAALLGLADQMGVLKPGKPAHFLVARGTPSQLPRKLSYLDSIFVHGQPTSRYRKSPSYRY